MNLTTFGYVCGLAVMMYEVGMLGNAILASVTKPRSIGLLRMVYERFSWNSLFLGEMARASHGLKTFNVRFGSMCVGMGFFLCCAITQAVSPIQALGIASIAALSSGAGAFTYLMMHSVQFKRARHDYVAFSRKHFA